MEMYYGPKQVKGWMPDRHHLLNCWDKNLAARNIMLIFVHALSTRKNQEKAMIQQICQICSIWQINPAHWGLWLRKEKAYLSLGTYHTFKNEFFYFFRFSIGFIFW